MSLQSVLEVPGEPQDIQVPSALAQPHVHNLAKTLQSEAACAEHASEVAKAIVGAVGLEKPRPVQKKSVALFAGRAVLASAAVDSCALVVAVASTSVVLAWQTPELATLVAKSAIAAAVSLP